MPGGLCVRAAAGAAALAPLAGAARRASDCAGRCRRRSSRDARAARLHVRREVSRRRVALGRRARDSTPAPTPSLEARPRNQRPSLRSGLHKIDYRALPENESEAAPALVRWRIVGDRRGRRTA